MCKYVSEHRLTWIPAWISKHMPSKVLDEIIYPFPNSQTSMAVAIKVWEWINNFISHIITDVIIYPCWDLS